MGALAAANSAYPFWQNLHWSPGGTAYALREGSLVELCPDAAQSSEVCADVLDLGERIASIDWIDGARFLWVTREPYDLYFGALDGRRILIAEGAERYAAVAQTCRNDAELITEADGQAQMQVAPGVLFTETWGIRNAGSCSWGPSYRLAFLGGDRLGGPRNLPLPEDVPPGGEIELSVNFIAPMLGGPYQGQWQLLGPDGSPFGHAATVNIVVPFDVPTGLTPGKLIAEVFTDSRPGRVAPGDRAAWVTHEGVGTVSRIDLDTNKIVTTVPVGGTPRSGTAAYGAAWVAHSNEASVSRIDPSTDLVSARIPLDLGPFAGTTGITAGGGAIWVTISGWW